MKKADKTEFKVLIKEGTIEALKSSEGQDAIVDAMGSHGGQGAIVDAMKSSGGQDAIVSALNSEKGQEVLVKSFVKGYHAMVEPMLEDIWHDVKTIKIELKYMKDKHGAKIERLERKVGLTV